jgi:Tfp pilus assembly protein PilF
VSVSAKRVVELTESTRSLMRSRRWLEAIWVLESDLDVTRTDGRLSWNLGWCYFKLNRLGEARRHLARAANLTPQNAMCTYALGLVYLRMKQFRKAERNLIESLGAKDLSVTRLTLALLYMQQGKVDEAEKLHLEGIRLKPKASDRYDSYACFLSDVGREREAEEMYDKARQLRRIV